MTTASSRQKNSSVMAESDDDSDECHERQADWERLSTMLSPEVFAALHSHLVGGNDTPSTTTQTILDVTARTSQSTSGLKSATDNSVFKEQGYWEDRFAEEDEYDWLLTYEQLQTHLIPLLRPLERILVVGCGNSGLSAGLYDSGFTDIVNIDFSETVIDKMKEIHSIERPLMRWITMDMTDMNFDSHCFDVVIDKASMDALMVDEGDVWHPKQSTIDITDKMCKGVKRVLVPHTGRFIQLSFAQPHFRTKYLMGIHTGVDSSTVSSNSTYGSSDSKYGSVTGRCEIYEWTLSFKTIDTEAGCLNSFLYIMEL